VILVEDHGTLVGLLTVKDVLKFTHLHERHEDGARGGTAGGSRVTRWKESWTICGSGLAPS
jgi:hypothetical protein